MTQPGDPGEPGQLDDRQLLAAHLSGDHDAFNRLVSRHRDRLWAVALRTTGDREEAFDALQDALLSALRGAASYRGDAAPSTWLHRIVVNAGLDRLRRRAARPAGHLHPDLDPADPSDDLAAAATRLDLQAALAGLPEAQRVAIVLVELEDIPVAEVAQLLGVPEGTVKSRCARGRLALARLLGDAYAGGPRAGSRSGSRSGRRAAGNPTPAAGVTPLTAGGPDGRPGTEVSR